MLKIIVVPNKILTSPTQSVVEFDENINNLVKEMETTLLVQDDPKGVGLAANQVNSNLSIFIIKPSEKAKTKVFINPRMLKSVTYSVKRVKKNKDTLNATRSTLHKKKEPVKLEGCLSIPRIWGPVKRANKIYLEYQDVTGKNYKKWFTGFEAVIIQHEMDHLQGVVFTQRSMEQNQPIYKETAGELVKVDLS